VKPKKTKKEDETVVEEQPVDEDEPIMKDQTHVRASRKRPAESESDEAPNTKKPKLEQGNKKQMSDDFLDFFD